MANDVYKARARRLAAHFKSNHGVTLSHSAALEAVAAEEGARDWNRGLGSNGTKNRDKVYLSIETI